MRTNTISSDDEVLTLPQAAKRRGVSPMTMRVWILAGRIPAKQAGRLLLVRAADVDADKAHAERNTAASA